jgi:hypothetical protein
MTDHLTSPLINDKVNVHIREEAVPPGVGIVCIFIVSFGRCRSSNTLRQSHGRIGSEQQKRDLKNKQRNKPTKIVVYNK